MTLFFTVQALLFWALCECRGPEQETNFLATTIDKHRRLRDTPPPRVIFVGGSSLAFGTRSEILEAALNRPVVNMGLASMLPREFLLNEVAEAVRKDDLVVLSLEYSLLCDEGRLLNVKQLLEYRPASFRFVPAQLQKRLLQDYGLMMMGTVVRRSLGFGVDNTGSGEAGAAYSRREFNRQGDYVGHYGRNISLASEPADSPVLRPPKLRPVPPKARGELERFARLCRERGARCVFICPPHPLEVLRPQLPLVEEMVSSLRGIPGLDVLDTPRDQVYALALFYDTPYHLTEAGVAQRTAKLIQALRPLL